MDQGKNYEQIIQYSEKMEIEGMTLQVLKLDFLIEVKQRAGRDKDIAVLPVLRNTLRIR
jgi:predicted nucleotidyltransferase